MPSRSARKKREARYRFRDDFLAPDVTTHRICFLDSHLVSFIARTWATLASRRARSFFWQHWRQVRA